MSGTVPTRSIAAVRMDDLDGIRTATVRCPWCEAEHPHVVPKDTEVGARIERSPKCDARRGIYTIELPEDTKA